MVGNLVLCMDSKVKEGVKVSYHEMFGEVAFVDPNYFCLQIADEGYCSGRPVRVCVPWDSQYTVHEETIIKSDPVLLEHIQETDDSQHRDQGQSGTVAGD